MRTIDGVHLNLVANVLHARFTGQLTVDACEALASLLDEQVRNNEGTSTVVEMPDFLDAPRGEAWEYLASNCVPWNKVKRLALVGEVRWALSLAVLCRMISPAKIRHFDPTALASAMKWAKR